MAFSYHVIFEPPSRSWLPRLDLLPPRLTASITALLHSSTPIDAAWGKQDVLCRCHIGLLLVLVV